MLTGHWLAVPDRFARALAGLDPGPVTVTAVLEAAREAVGSRLAKRGAARLFAVGSTVNGTAISGSVTLDALVIMADDQRPGAAGLGAFCERFRRDLVGGRRPAAADANTEWVTPAPPGRRRRPGPAATLHVRLRPCFVSHEDCFLVPLPAGWQSWSPDRHRRRVADADDASDGNARRLIRLAKLWRSTRGVPLPSPLLDRLVCRFLEVWPYRRRSLFFADWMVRDFFFWLSAQPAPRDVPDWRAAAAESRRLARAASDLERDGEAVAALLVWRRLFGEAFPDTAAPGTGSEADANLAEMTPVRQVADRVRRLRERVDPVDHRP